MQGDTDPATLLDLSTTAHLTNALQLSGIPAHMLLPPGDSNSRESGQDDRCNKSSWIRRLKPRDELEFSKGGLAEAAPGTLPSEGGDSAERMDVSSRIGQLGCFQQDKATTASRVRANWKIERAADSKRRKTSSQKDCDVAEMERMDVCQEKTLINESGKNMSATATAPPSNVGFGPWVNLSSGRKPDGKSELALGSKNTVGTTSAQESFKAVQGSFRTPPLSPIQSKLGLPPRPPSQKTPGFHPPSKIAPLASGMGRGVFCQLARDIQPDRQLSEVPLNREAALARQVVGVQDKEPSHFAEAANARAGSSFQKPKASEQSFPYSVREHGKGISDCGQQFFASSSTSLGNGDLPVKQLSPRVVERVAHGNTDLPVKQLSPSFAMGNSDLPVKQLSPSVVERVDMGQQLGDCSDGGVENGRRGEPKRIAPQQSSSRSRHGTSMPEKADASSSNSASLPWEMFVEPAGASKKAREQFVEVYNRARDELKNQRMSLGRASKREMDGGPKLTLGPGDAVSDYRFERQSMKHEQHSAGHSQVQERLKILSQNSEHGTLSLSSNLKEQHAISLAESKGPASNLENEQSGLHKDTALPLKSGTPSMQAEVMGRVLHLSEGQLSLNLKTAVQESDKKTACERLDERSVAHSKGLRRRDKDGQSFSSNSDANPKQLVLKLNGDIKRNGLGQVSRQLDVDRQELIPVLGKRSEDHAISRVAEKSAVYRARPQIWLQRWHPIAAYNFKDVQDSQVPSDGKKSDSVGFLALGMKSFKDGDGVGAFSQVRELMADKEKGVRSTRKMLPSAAAMAIVGTAARQFCSAQPERKGSFAFWSGFGMQPPRKVEPIQEKGKGKMMLKADANMPNR